jgi:hypothetical protein
VTPDVIKVKALPDFLLEAEFANGEIRRFDVRPLLDYPAFSALREGSLFMAAKVVNGTVTWTDEIDLSPDTLYLRGQVVQSNQKAEAPAAV